MKIDVREEIEHIETVEELSLKIIQLKDMGASKSEIASTLNAYALELRGKGEEEREDRILEILDFVEGWCHPDKAIFSEHLYSESD